MAETTSEILELILPSRAEISETAPVLGSAYAILFTGEDTLAINSSNSVAGVVVSIHGRLYDRKRGIIPFAFDHVPFADRSVKRDAFPLGPCYLMNVTVFVRSGAPRVGQTFVQLQVLRGTGAAAYQLATLLQGYVTRYQTLAYPGSPLRDSIEGGGVIRSLIGTAPAVADNWYEQVPTGARWQLLNVFCQFTASATPGNRQPVVTYYNAAYPMMVAPHPIVTEASGVAWYSWAVDMFYPAPLGTFMQSAGLPTAPILLDSYVISVYVYGMQPGDRWGPPQLTIQEWIEVA